MLAATLSDIVESMGKAQAQTVQPKEEWQRRRERVQAATVNLMKGTPDATEPAAATVAACALTEAAAASKSLATIPPEAPMLPESTIARPDLIEALKASVLKIGANGANSAIVTAPAKTGQKKQHSGSQNVGELSGMGGVGKTMIAAALVRDGELLSAFDKICWVSVSAEPDVPSLQQTLYRQVIGQPLSEAAKADELIALEELKAAAKDVAVLLVLDDVWSPAHAKVLNFVHGSALRSAVVVTTRMRNLLGGASEVRCGVLSTAATLELLLRAGACEELLDNPPPVALEAVELCGRLPLALGIAGGIMWALVTLLAFGDAAGAQRTWASLKLLEKAGKGSKASRVLEWGVLQHLLAASVASRMGARSTTS